MGCWHGCGSWHGWPSPRDWYGPPVGDPDWYAEEPWPVRPRLRRRVRSADRGSAAELEARLDALQDELEQVHAALADLRRPSAGAGSDEDVP